MNNHPIRTLPSEQTRDAPMRLHSGPMYLRYRFVQSRDNAFYSPHFHPRWYGGGADPMMPRPNKSGAASVYYCGYSGLSCCCRLFEDCRCLRCDSACQTETKTRSLGLLYDGLLVVILAYLFGCDKKMKVAPSPRRVPMAYVKDPARCSHLDRLEPRINRTMYTPIMLPYAST